MRRNASLGICLAIALGIVGCQNQSTEPAAPAEGGQSLAVAAPRLRLNPTALPSSARLSDRVFANSNHVIDPEAYKCRDATRVGNWFNSQLNQIPQGTLVRLVNEFAAHDIPFVDALFLLPDGTPQEFGYTGQYTTLMQNTHTRVKGFWNLFTPDIQLVAMKGSVLLDVNRVAAIYENFFSEGVDSKGKPIPITHANAVLYATQLRDLVVNTRSLNGGDHALFSFNAFAIGAIRSLGIVDKIAMGDGILAGYEAAGLGDVAAVAPQAVYAHEFGHHIQFQNGYFNDKVPGATTQAELTRYTELMADAYAAYYLAHQFGANKPTQQVRDVLRVFFNIGDCAFTNPNHHGTPNQRAAAADFGIEVASRGGAILTQQAFHALFVAKYPELVAADRN